MPYTHMLTCSDGLWLAYQADGRWIGRPVGWSCSENQRIRARYKVDILVPLRVIAITAL